MKNKILIMLLGILLLGSIIAGGIAIYEKVTFDNSLQSAKVIPEKIIIFDCGGKSMSVIGTEPDEKYDKQDIQTLTNVCPGKVENIQNSKGEYFECVGTICSFDTMEKKLEECRFEGKVYDSKTNGCILEPTGGTK